MLPPPLPIAGADYRGGWWSGNVFGVDPGGGPIQASAIMTEDGRFRILQASLYDGSPRSSILFSGRYDLGGGLLSSTGTAFADAGSAWLDGSVVTNYTASAAVVWPVGEDYEDGTLTGTWSTDSGTTGGFELSYSHVYNTPSNLGWLAGDWSAMLEPDGSWPRDGDWNWPFLGELDPDRLATMTVLEDGTFIGADAYGCGFFGRFSVIDARFNVLSVDNTIVGCERAGEYRGLAWYTIADTAWWQFGRLYNGVTINFTADDGEHVQILQFVQRK